MFNDKDFARKLIIFEGLEWGKIRPTDVDFKIELWNQYQLLGEFKYYREEDPYGHVPQGQRVALQVSVDDFERAGKKSCFFIAIWKDKDMDVNGDIKAKDCIVSRYYTKGSWFMPRKEITVKEFCELFFSHEET